MATVLMSFAVVAASVAGLAAGLLLRRRPLQGSCASTSCLRGVGCHGFCHRRHGQCGG